ncbi:hypothetical protein CBM2604_A60530 [Cupriavidus taiwanensis]|nr:hypothetical protein CBM2604_A60530 [Cupriavidus taiwanensis]SOZ46705.1 hypothetical protein CBM2610_A80492 [Cupriavidus taiwanensis]
MRKRAAGSDTGKHKHQQGAARLAAGATPASWPARWLGQAVVPAERGIVTRHAGVAEAAGSDGGDALPQASGGGCLSMIWHHVRHGTYLATKGLAVTIADLKTTGQRLRNPLPAMRFADTRCRNSSIYCVATASYTAPNKKKHPETDIMNSPPRASPHQAAFGCPKPRLCPILPCSAPAPASRPRRPGLTAQHPPSTEA